MTHPTCRQPDHDGLGGVCGYPLPCPWHTVIIDVASSPATVTTPATAIVHPVAAVRVQQIAATLGQDLEPGPSRHRRRRRR